MLLSMISPSVSFMYRTLEYEAHTVSLDKYIKREANPGINAGLHDFMKKHQVFILDTDNASMIVNRALVWEKPCKIDILDDLTVLITE